MSICQYCEREKKTTDSCLATMIDYEDGLSLPTIPYMPEPDELCCPDCWVSVGMVHHPNCDQEKCPRCGGQLISCDCEVRQ